MEHNVVALRKQLLANDYWPIPTHSKICYFPGHNNPAVMDKQWLRISKWPNRFTGTGVIVRDGLVVLDLDIRNADLCDRLLDRIKEIAPDVYTRALMRHGKAPKLALFAQLARGEELFARWASNRYGTSKKEPSHIVEIFAGALTDEGHYSRYFAVYGPHTIKDRKVELEYSWEGNGLFEVPFKQLPVITRQQCLDICDAFNQLAVGSGLSVLHATDNSGDGTQFVYDIDDATEFEMKGRQTIKTYDQLNIGERCSASFYEPRWHERDDSCHVQLCRLRNCIGVFDFKINGWHLPKDLKPIDQLDFPKPRNGTHTTIINSDIAPNSARGGFILPQYIRVTPDKIPKRAFLYGHRLARKCISATVAPGGTGKTSLILTEALAMISGKPLLRVQPPGRLRVAILSLEDTREELTRRIEAIAKRHGLNDEDFGDRLFLYVGAEQPFVIAKKGRDETLVMPLVGALTQELKRLRIDVTIVDPFIGCHEVPENDNSGINSVVKAWLRVAEDSNCAVDLVHHVRKGEKEITTESARGGGAFGDACRMVRVINRMTEHQGQENGIPDEGYRRYFCTYIDKNNLAPPLNKRDWFQLTSEDLGQGDQVGVVENWTYPEVNACEAEFRTIDFAPIEKALVGRSWRLDLQSPQWVGRPIADVLAKDVTTKQSRQWLKTFIAYLIAQKCLVKVKKLDQKSVERIFVEISPLLHLSTPR